MSEEQNDPPTGGRDPTPTQLPPYYGHGVSGERFWPRPLEVSQVETTLRRGGAVKLFGQRRSGKSSVLQEAARRLRGPDGQDRAVVEVNCEGMDAVTQLFRGIIRAFPDNRLLSWRERLSSMHLPDTVCEILAAWGSGKARHDNGDEELVSRHWGAIAQEITGMTREVDQPPVLMVDELPFMLQNIYERAGGQVGDIVRLLAAFRDWRDAGMPMALAGSVGLTQYLRIIGVSRHSLTGIPPVRMQPLSRDNALAMLKALASAEPPAHWHPAIAEAIVDRVVMLSPACLQFAFDYVHRALATGARAGAPDLVDRVFTEEIRRDFDKEFFNQFDERLGDYTADDQGLARRLFASLAAANRDRSRDTLIAVPFDTIWDAVAPSEADGDRLADLIGALDDDGFLIDDPDRQWIGFADNMVRAWWRSRDHRRGRRRG